MTTFIAGGTGMQYRPYRERVQQITDDIRKEEGRSERAL
jgi:hypothetical protein